MEDKLYSLYLDSPSGYSTSERLWQAARKSGLEVTQSDVKKIMSSWDTATRFTRKYKKPALRDRVIAVGPFDLFQADLAFLPKYKGFIGFLIV